MLTTTRLMLGATASRSRSATGQGSNVLIGKLTLELAITGPDRAVREIINELTKPNSAGEGLVDAYGFPLDVEIQSKLTQAVVVETVADQGAEG